MSGILQVLESRKYAVTQEEIFSGSFERLIERGLRVLTLCYDGTGRSKTTADTLSLKFGIPSARLERGIKGVEFDLDKSSLPFLITALNSCPNVAIILTAEELSMHNWLISQLRAYRYNTSDAAVRSIEIIEG